MPSAQNFSLSKSFFETVGDMSSSDAEAIREVARSVGGYSPEEDTIERMHKRLPRFQKSTLASICYTIDQFINAFTEGESYEKSREKLIDVLTASEKDVEEDGIDFKKFIKNFKIITENDEIFQSSLKKNRLLSTIIPILTGLRSFIDLRPDIDSSRKKITIMYPVLIVSIETTGDSDRRDYTTFQLDSDGLKKLEDFVSDCRSKLHLVEREINK